MPQPTLAKRRPPSKTTARENSRLETAKTLIIAGLVVMALRTFVFQPFTIPSGSMIPTLLVGDYLFVSKYAYGYSRFSFLFSPDLFSGRIFGRLPERGDVAVFRLPRDTSIDYIKRIVGLPGDRIQMRGGQLFINGVQVPREPAPNPEYVAEGEGPRIADRQYIETLPDTHRRHLIIKEFDQGGVNDTPEFHVPPGYLFAMGDNRDNSQDSRFMTEVGFIPVENLVGRAEFVFFSVDANAPFWQFWEWPLEIRWSRLFTGIN